jgi:hypothetical protein
VDAEPISESHGRTWAADVPLLGSAVTTSTLTTFDLTSEDAMAAVQDEPLVREGRNAFEAWLARAGRGSA